MCLTGKDHFIEICKHSGMVNTKFKGKVSPVRATKAHTGSRITPPLFLTSARDGEERLLCFVRFTSEKQSRYILNIKLCRPTGKEDDLKNGKNFLLLKIYI